MRSNMGIGSPALTSNAGQTETTEPSGKERSESRSIENPFAQRIKNGPQRLAADLLEPLEEIPNKVRRLFEES